MSDLTDSVTAAQTCAAWLYEEVYGASQSPLMADIRHISQDYLTTLRQASARIARNAQRQESLTTDNLGLALVTTQGNTLGRLWSYLGDNRWMSLFCTPEQGAQAAVEAWVKWAFGDDAQPFVPRLIDAEVPLLSGRFFAVSHAPAPRRAPFVSYDAAVVYADVVSVVETCKLQKLDAQEFLAKLLCKGALV